MTQSKQAISKDEKQLNRIIDWCSKMIVVHYAAIEASINLGDADGAGSYATRLAHFVRTTIPGIA